MRFSDWYVRRGRISRRTWWLHYFLPLAALGVLAGIADLAVGSATLESSAGGGQASASFTAGWITAVAWLVTLVPALTSEAARLHDRGLSAWWLLLNLLPLIGQLVLLVLVGFLPGDRGANRYGPPPDRSNVPV
ncbi:DUF805 domain-containing protein [Geodermatophilus sp. YIM 151500]|uniref:DUF805 domain-containing protein n=1 Tax=Geodermatophilus sp. YIM 151500 TaxID=2984531 RepID=UPI0021E4D602|nr:DUF805 domain-containing protein [Geodermatophilus sp. YIM 151500]MCV2488524.1 DUF805 domain-containing protein [Geodermatophilus sp. YIM 151500]